MNSPMPAKSSIPSIAASIVARQAQDGAVEADVRALSALREPGSQLEQRRDATAHGHAAAGRPVDARQHLQGRRLSGAVLTHQAEGAAALDLEERLRSAQNSRAFGGRPRTSRPWIDVRRSVCNQNRLDRRRAWIVISVISIRRCPARAAGTRTRRPRPRPRPTRIIWDKGRIGTFSP